MASSPTRVSSSASSARDVRGRRAHDTEGTQLAAHPRPTGEPGGNRDDEGQADLDRDKHQDHVIDAVHLHADENGLVIDDLGSHSERAQLFEVHGVRSAIGGHMRQDLQRGLIQVGHREVGDNRTGHLPILAHVLKGALGDAGTAKPRPLGPAGDNRSTGTRHTPARLLDSAGALVGVVVRVHLIVRRVLYLQVLARALRETMQLGIHVGQHPGAHDQGGRRHHDDERERHARRQGAREAPGQGRPPRHWGSRMM